MSEEIPIELAENWPLLQREAIADLSVYRLMVEEEYLFPRYYKAGDSILDLACGLGRTTGISTSMGQPCAVDDRSRALDHSGKTALSLS